MEISRDDLIDLLDGEGVIVSDGMDVCFNHQTFLNNKCLECGYGPEGETENDETETKRKTDRRSERVF